jgi:hypothetical protein
MFGSMQVPSPRGPRQPGQDSALVVATELERRPMSKIVEVKVRFMAFSTPHYGGLSVTSDIVRACIYRIAALTG